MSTTDKNFKVLYGLDVNGPASANTIVIDNTPITVNSETKRIQANVNNQWLQLSLLSDIPQSVVDNIEVQYDGN
jgi:hypothetical protein